MDKNFQSVIGDIFLIRSNGFIGKLVRLLISVRYGITFKDAYSHIEVSYDSEYNLSAEPSGAKLMKSDRFNTKSDYIVYRLKRMDQEKKETHKKISESFIGKGYAYTRYAIDILRIGSFFLFLLGILFLTIGAIFSVTISHYLTFGSAFLLVLSTAIQQVLSKKDVLTHDCTELTSLILTINGLWVPTVNSRNEFPDGMKQVLDNLVLNEKAEIVYEKNN